MWYKIRTTVGNALKDLKAIGLLEYYQVQGKQCTNYCIFFMMPIQWMSTPLYSRWTPLFSRWTPPVQQMDTPCSADGHPLYNRWTPPVQQMNTVLPNEVLPNYNNNVRKKLQSRKEILSKNQTLSLMKKV